AARGAVTLPTPATGARLRLRKRRENPHLGGAADLRVRRFACDRARLVDVVDAHEDEAEHRLAPFRERTVDDEPRAFAAHRLAALLEPFDACVDPAALEVRDPVDELL